MKRFIKGALVALTLLLGTAAAQAHYYDMANQLTNMVGTAIRGGFNYRGMVDASYTVGVGNNGASSLELTTTQGFKYSNWFFMGAGAGVNIVFGGYDSSDGSPRSIGSWGSGFNPSYKVHDTGVMIPLFSDFRFIIGKEDAVDFFIDLRLGAAFLVGKNYIRTQDGYLDNSEGFYFKPTIGCRVPVNSQNSKQAINFGVSYQLITNNAWNWYGSYNGTTVNSIGASIGFEW